MPPRSLQKPWTRKPVKQERSEAMIEAILAAATSELVSKGYEKTTTNRIASAAGVSVGSLYQYFPDKEAIVVELMRRYRARTIELARSALASVVDLPLSTVVRAVVTGLVDTDPRERGLTRVLIERVALTEARREFRGFEDELAEIVAGALERAPERLAVRDRKLAGYVIVRTVQALVHAAMTDAPRYDAKTLAREGTDLVLRYLGHT